MTALKELFLIRHGEAEHLVRNLTGGVAAIHSAWRV